LAGDFTSTEGEEVTRGNEVHDKGRESSAKMSINAVGVWGVLFWRGGRNVVFKGRKRSFKRRDEAIK